MFDSQEILTKRDKNISKMQCIRIKVMKFSFIVVEKIPQELVKGHIESLMEIIYKDDKFTSVWGGGRRIPLSKHAPPWRDRFWCQVPKVHEVPDHLLRGLRFLLMPRWICDDGPEAIPIGGGATRTSLS